MCFAARAARAFTRFWASFARASGDSGRRVFRAFLITFFVALAGLRGPLDAEGGTELAEPVEIAARARIAFDGRGIADTEVDARARGVVIEDRAGAERPAGRMTRQT